ncbi:MAG TPA: hypothetical protein VJ507_02555 [Candidatus Bathyarchaeia archaeon]|nr:hypothetical protein [Candidatus Bathyarchaeia archaeon]
MSRNSKKYLLLFLILAFSFIYRVLLILRADFPPGADIGLHNSVIHSITSSGNVDLLWNNYQMGGGLSLTFPGYHIFVSQIILVTGLPDYLAHTLIVAFFSTLIVACAFLITRKMWMESTAFIVAFLVAVSRFDVEMLLWGGYPNVVTLMLIPLIFYLFLQSDRFSLSAFLGTASLLSGALILSHSLSALVFVGTTIVVVAFAAVLSKKLGMPKKRLLLWLVPILLGTIIVLPFLVNAAPAYLGANTSLVKEGAQDITLALLSTRILPWEILAPLTACVILFFLYSRYYKGKFLTISTLLLALWILVSVAFTQGYLVGFYIDYNRFLYFTVLPVIILIAVVIDHSATLFSRVTDTYLSFTKSTWRTKKTALRLAPYLNRKNIYSGFVLVSLLFTFFAVQLFVTPWESIRMQNYYQVMTDPGYEAIQWAKDNTPTNSVFVSDALYGWWFGGFAQRPTISAVDPQYLTLSREFEPAKAAKNLLDTDYVIDNGLIQVREDGGYIGRHNPMFLANINWSYFPYPFFNFDNDDTKVTLKESGNVRSFDLSQLSVKMIKLENTSDQAKLSIIKENNFFTLTQILTVYQNVRFVNMSMALESTDEGVSLINFDAILHIRGQVISLAETVGMFDEGGKVLGQLIYVENRPQNVVVITPENPSGLWLSYNLQGESSGNIQLFASAFSVSDKPEFYQNQATKAKFINGVLSDNLQSYLNPNQNGNQDLDIDVFDYRNALSDWNVSYVAVRDAEIIPKFARDPAFNLLFINDDVAIFIVK